MSKKPKAPLPWHPADYQPEDTAAIKALAAGNANDGQQKRALNWIVYTLCGTYDLSYRPHADGERDTAFAEGKRFVGLQLVKMTKITTSANPKPAG